MLAYDLAEGIDYGFCMGEMIPYRARRHRDGWVVVDDDRCVLLEGVRLEVWSRCRGLYGKTVDVRRGNFLRVARDVAARNPIE